MKQVSGIWLPDGDRHFGPAMDRAPLRRLQGRAVGTYQADRIDLALARCKKRRVAVDAGAHVGYWSMWLAEAFAAVHAFEPLGEHVDCWLRNVTQPNARLHQVALGCSQQPLHMVRDPDNSGRAHAGAAGEAVAQIALDDMGLRKVDFIKIDVEGMEADVIAGARATLTDSRPLVMLEQKGHGRRYGHAPQAAADLLHGLGMKPLRRLGDDWLWGWKKPRGANA